MRMIRLWVKSMYEKLLAAPQLTILNKGQWRPLWIQILIKKEYFPLDLDQTCQQSKEDLMKHLAAPLIPTPAKALSARRTRADDRLLPSSSMEGHYLHTMLYQLSSHPGYHTTIGTSTKSIMI